MKKSILLILTLFFLPSCVSESNFNQHLNSYIGKSSNSLLNSLGPPNQTLTIPKNKLIWSYNASATRYVGTTSTNSNTGNTTTFLNPYSVSCSYWFVLDHHQIVTKTGHNGDNCQTSSDGQAGFALGFWGGTVLPPAKTSP